MRKEMTGDDRYGYIYNYLLKHGTAKPEVIAPLLGVSEVTIRRDFAILATRKLLKRVHGGATLLLQKYQQTPIWWRIKQDVKKKRALAAHAVGLIKKGDSIFVDSGSTCYFLSEQLPRELGIKVITHSLESINIMKDIPGITIYCPGGELIDEMGAFFGILTENSLKSLFVDKAFIGCSGFTPQIGFLEGDMRDLKLKSIMNSQARNSYILTTSDKFNISPLHCSIPINEVKEIITDDGVAPELVRLLEEKEIKVMRVPT